MWRGSGKGRIVKAYPLKDFRCYLAGALMRRNIYSCRKLFACGEKSRVKGREGGIEENRRTKMIRLGLLGL